MELSEQLKMATRMGMKAGVAMAISALEAAANDPRSSTPTTVKEALGIAINLLREGAEKRWPEGAA